VSHASCQSQEVTDKGYQSCASVIKFLEYMEKGETKVGCVKD